MGDCRIESALIKVCDQPPFSFSMRMLGKHVQTSSYTDWTMAWINPCTFSIQTSVILYSVSYTIF